MRGVQTSGSPRCGLLTAVLVALSCALLWNVVLLNQKVACDVAAGRIKADAELTIKCVARATPGARSRHAAAR